MQINKTSKPFWAHVTCVSLIPELKFLQNGFKESVEIIKEIPFWRFFKRCCICKEKSGVCIYVNKNTHVNNSAIINIAFHIFMLLVLLKKAFYLRKNQ